MHGPAKVYVTCVQIKSLPLGEEKVASRQTEGKKEAASGQGKNLEMQAL